MVTSLRELVLSEIRDIAHSPISVFSPEDFASQVLGVLKETDRYEAAVSSGGSVGLITVRDLLDVDQPAQRRVDKVWRATGSVSPSTSVIEVAELLVRNNVRALPVVERGEVTGIISQEDLIRVMCDVNELSGYGVKELLRSPVWSLDIDERNATARRLMLERGISHIPVVEYGRLVGEVTAETIVHAFITPSSKTTTGDRVGERGSRFPGQVMGVMDIHPVTLRPDSTVLDAVRGLRDRGKGACYITDEGGRMLGILTPRELLAPILRFRVQEEMPVYIMGLSDEDFFERAVAEEKVRRVVRRGRKFRPDINEVSIRIKVSQTQGLRNRYELTARALSPSGQVNAKAEGWDLLEVFDELCTTLEKAIRRTKAETPGGTRRRRSRR
ncbi:CBS domain-containing protein [Candidatus Bathyarchaeota archaeon]|nr:CBS domain-containing protein [Candidatus Bathyarchaeota archaeon]MBL7167679.1 CBS domain-containing protein [Candidatus Bathyarchaeota archaeon]